MRSLWKYIPYSPLSSSGRPYTETAKHRIHPDLLDKRLTVYNGKKFESLIVRSYMLKNKMSFFLSSRYSGKNIHIKKKKRRKK